MISLIYTSARAHLVKEHIEHWLNQAENPLEIECVLAVDSGSEDKFYALGEIRNTKVVINYDGNNCVAGWNTACRNSLGDTLLQLSDDLYPPKHWDILIKNKLKGVEYGALAISDGLTASLDFLPHSIITRKVFQEWGSLFSNAYSSMFCDQHFSEVVKRNGWLINAQEIVFEHRNGIKDEVAKKHNAYYKSGRETFDYMRRNGFKPWLYDKYLTSDTSDDMYSSNPGVRLPYFNQKKSREFYLDSHKKSLAIRCEKFGQLKTYKNLQVLIPTTKSREEFLWLLTAELKRQGIQYILDEREDVSVGEKRNNLIKLATAKFISFIDSDDWCSHDYREKIEEAITHNPNINCYKFYVMTNVNNNKPKLSVFNTEGINSEDEVYHRSVNHLCVWDRQALADIKFPNISRGEDSSFAKDVLPLAKSSMMIPSVLYFYEYQNSTTETQKTIKPVSVQKDGLTLRQRQLKKRGHSCE